MSWIDSVILQQYCLSKVILEIYMSVNLEFLSVMLKNNSMSQNYSTENV